ncbi:MAG TPA: cobalamin-independent methionine synthase II family protein [Solirubrobacteraceae bacterium]
MFTATKGLLLPVTVTGSWPRPRWFTARMDGRPLTTCLKDVTFREQLTDALAALLVDQERAGLDVATHGDFFHDEDLGGHSWHRYPLERWAGMEGDFLAGERLSAELVADYGPGTILREVMGGWAWPRVVGKVEPNEANPLDYAKLWRLAQARTHLPIKFGTVSAQGIHHFPDIHTDLYADDRRQLIWDMAGAMNTELRALAAAGCTVIQVEEPMIHFVAATRPGEAELLDFLIDAFNREVDGLDGVEVWVHTCWGNPNMQRAAANPSYANSIEAHLERMHADVWTVEMKDGDQTELELFAPYKGRMRTKVSVGVVSHRTLQVETPDEVADLARAALRHIDPENLILSSDCGFGRQGANRLIAYYKAAAIAQGANIIRRELGGEERPVPATDPALQVDVLPAGAGHPA